MGFLDRILGIFGKKKEPARPVRRPEAVSTRTETVKPAVTTATTPVRTPKQAAPARTVRAPKTAQAQHVSEYEIAKQREMELVKKEQAFLKELEDEWVRRELTLKEREEELQKAKQELEQKRLSISTEQLAIDSGKYSLPAGIAQPKAHPDKNLEKRWSNLRHESQN
jgi:hypothetical protein